MIKFIKYQANGNDFILLDNQNNDIPKLDTETIQKLCNRKLGIGADGILILESSNKYDFKLIYFNSDGSENFCCNGTRCAIKYFYEQNPNKTSFDIIAYDGQHKAFIENALVNLEMNNIKTITNFKDDLFINTGAPHYLIFTNEIDKLDIKTEALNKRKVFNKATNITFIEPTNTPSIIKATTFEQGVEEETLACGTGAVAAAIGITYKSNVESPIIVKMKGGDFEVKFNKNTNEKEFYSNIYIKGKEQKVFEGKIDL